MRKRLLIVTALAVGLVGAALPAGAQVNTEKMRTKKPKVGWHGFFEGALLLQTGNTEIFTAGLGARLEYNYKVHSPFLQGSYILGAKNDEKYLHNGFLHARWPAMWHRRVGTELFSQLQFDDFKRLGLRTLVGAGIRVAVVLHDKIDVHVGSGYMFEYEQLDYPEEHPANDPHPDKTYSHRWTSYLSIHLQITDWLDLLSITYAQPRFDRFSDVRVLHDLALEFKVYKTLKLVFSFILAYDSDPPMTVKKLDTQTLTKLRVEF